MAVRICTIGVPFFMNGGLEVGRGWLPAPSTLTEKQRETLRKFHGRLIQVHPEDLGNLKEYGLAFVDAGSPLVEAKTVKPAAPAKAGDQKSTPKNDAANGSEKKEG